MAWTDSVTPERTAAAAHAAGERSVAEFQAAFTALFETGFPRLYRLLNRMSGEPDLAADLAQDAFVRLYRRGALPDAPDAWLATVALNLLRNARRSGSRRRRLMSVARGLRAHADPPPAPDLAVEAAETRRRARETIARMSERERSLLLLHAEGYRYREIAGALGLHEASVGTLLARARQAFRDLYEGRSDAP